MNSFFGATEDGNGGWKFNNMEKIPDNWYNRKAPYTLVDVNNEINAQYLEHPVLFGGNAGKGNFNALGTFSAIKNGKLDTSRLLCLIYQLATENVPSSLSGVLELPLVVVGWAAGKLNPIYKNFGCPLRTI
jgi:unspecific peroxygenase